MGIYGAIITIDANRAYSMARSPLHSVLQHLRMVFLAKDAEHLSDIDLAHRFADRRDEAAFAASMSRHGAAYLRQIDGVFEI